jgi:hypothetical protein
MPTFRKRSELTVHFANAKISMQMPDEGYFRENIITLKLKCPNSVTGCEWSGIFFCLHAFQFEFYWSLLASFVSHFF